MTYLAMPSLSENRAQRSRPNQSMLSARSCIHNGSFSSDDQPDTSGASLLDNLPGFECFWNRNQQISSTSKVRGLQNIGARRISSDDFKVIISKLRGNVSNFENEKGLTAFLQRIPTILPTLP
jgi:hypothetical protein